MSGGDRLKDRVSLRTDRQSEGRVLHVLRLLCDRLHERIDVHVRLELIDEVSLRLRDPRCLLRHGAHTETTVMRSDENVAI